jgi:transposase-like protein
MNCPHCESHRTHQLNPTTRLGYKKYACQDCSKQYNERTGTKFNFITYPTTIVILVVQYYYLFKVSLEDVVKLMLMRGFHLSHQTIHNWVQTFGPELALKRLLSIFCCKRKTQRA